LSLSFVARPAEDATGILLDGAEATKIKTGGEKPARQCDRPITSRYENSAIVN
jgi:hypothetical protein